MITRRPKQHGIHSQQIPVDSDVELDSSHSRRYSSRRNARFGEISERHTWLNWQHKIPLICRLIVGFTLLILGLLQSYAFIIEKQGPLDHVMAIAVWKPYYGMFCPEFSSDNGMPFGNSLERQTWGDAQNVTIWECSSISSINNNTAISQFPQIFMIGARDKEDNTFIQWKQVIQQSTQHVNTTSASQSSVPRFQRINTLKISNQYARSGGALRQPILKSLTNSTQQLPTPLQIQNQFLCRGMKWEQRLFAVYQSVFAKLLSSYPQEDDFVIVEDDSLLINPTAFFEEVCNSRSHQMKFYSLYRSPFQWQSRNSISCIYQHGTVAFYIQRSLMVTIVKEKRRGWFCRFPIDMYISSLGPWYATRREIVVHANGGRVGSTR